MGSLENTRGTPLRVAVARVFWMMFGPVALLFCAVKITSKGGDWLTPIDFAFFGVLASMLMARLMEFRSGEGRTAEGQPLTASGLRRYFMVTAVVAIAIWLGAHLIGGSLLMRTP